LSILFLYVYLFQLRATYRCLLTVILYMCVNVSGAFSLRASTRVNASRRESTRADARWRALTRVNARQRVRNRTCLDLRRVDARRRVMHIHEPVIDSAQAQVINNNKALVEAVKARRNI